MRFIRHPPSTNSAANQSSNSGWVGGSARNPKLFGDRTMASPNRCCQSPVHEHARGEWILRIRDPRRVLQTSLRRFRIRFGWAKLCLQRRDHRQCCRSHLVQRFVSLAVLEQVNRLLLIRVHQSSPVHSEHRVLPSLAHPIRHRDRLAPAQKIDAMR